MNNILKWASNDGSFKRQASVFRNWITADGPFKPEPSRYVLYVSLACPWAHRTLVARKLKGLEDVIDVSIVHYLLEEGGWRFASDSDCPGAIPDPIYNAKRLSELYFKSDAEYSGRFTVPVLFDRKEGRIVSNESADILRMFNSAFNSYAKHPELDLYPEELRAEIDSINGWLYDDFNNGVYRAGFAAAQDKYEEAAVSVGDAMVRVEGMLSKQRYVVGDRLTESDIRLFTTAVRFDPVYFVHFKCNLLSTRECPNLLRWMRMMYGMVGETVNMEHIKRHYYMSHKQLNPTGIVPLSNGPDLH